MKWFGEPCVNGVIQQTDVPVGATCIYCRQPILETQSGMVLPFDGAEGAVGSNVVYHRPCFFESMGVDETSKVPDPAAIADRLEAALGDTSVLEYLILECETLQPHDAVVRARLHEALFAAARWLLEHDSPERFVWSALRTGACWGKSRDLAKLIDFLNPEESEKVRQVSLQIISNVSPHGPQPLLPELAHLRFVVGGIIRDSCTPQAVAAPSQAALAIAAIAAGVALGLPVEPVGRRAFEAHPLLLRQLENELTWLRERWAAPKVSFARCPDCELLGPEEAPVCHHMRGYPRCPECGGRVLLTAKRGRTREVLRGIHVAIPDDFLLPTCVECGEQLMVIEISSVLDPILLAKVSEAAAGDEKVEQQSAAQAKLIQQARAAARCWVDEDGIGAYYLDALVSAVRGYEAAFHVDDPLPPELGSVPQGDEPST